jgi:hypothetical protein
VIIALLATRSDHYDIPVYPETKGVPLEEMDAVFGEGETLLSRPALFVLTFTLSFPDPQIARSTALADGAGSEHEAFLPTPRPEDRARGKDRPDYDNDEYEEPMHRLGSDSQIRRPSARRTSDEEYEMLEREGFD